MTTGVLSVFGFAVLFAVFGALGLGEKGKHCQGCPHSGGCSGACDLEETGDPT